ncbi:6-methylsalicylic acid synthase [Diplodia corticola]|uniref:6-methylsalicylic acid synthase n=1 Tax=Diplodia corticola TaxID=236234 RepID=A0A1J9RSD2_9PEZI|nr:6-methylsalicylic acid synthase [Diplodia corticola]OJD30788.1 6-methylsalicylic acid synthase [Diplodia corticola]
MANTTPASSNGAAPPSSNASSFEVLSNPSTPPKPVSLPGPACAAAAGPDRPRQHHYEDVAIIGMSCRAAGDNTSPEKLWQFLLDKKDASGEVPKKRWEPWYRRDVRNPKEIDKAINRGYFIQNLEDFDASFFGISPKEAEQMDPHQRLGLELSWEALENAGIDPKTLAGSDTAVYMGVDSDDYSRLLLEDIPNIEAWMGIGSTAHGIPNRISYHFDLMGPSSAVDAACASSLVAVHMGRQAIATGESNVAIVGGVNVLCSPALFVMLGKAGALSPDGVCLSFDDDAHGYARGEGGAVLVLKRLADAIADNDNVLAVLKGSALAQDGKTNGIMAPNAKAQELVARQALERSGVDPLTVNYIEAHATSTSLGDPTEVSAISAVYGKGRPADAPAHIGSIKPNVGHLEAAAGAISLVKAVLAVNKGELAPQTRLQKLNTRVDWEKSGLKVVRERTKWAEPQGVPRRAAVCSYGYGGSVSHVVIEESPSSVLGITAVKEEEHKSQGPVTLVISAPQEKRLANQASVLADWLAGAGKDEDLKAVAATLALRRAPHHYRATFIVASHEEAVESLRTFAKGGSVEFMADGRVFDNATRTDAVWVFSGHGAQWADMGKELLQNSVFLQAVAPLDEIVQKEVGYSAIKVLETGDFEDSDRIQVLTYVVQVGLSQVLRSKGVEPQAVIGHSVGEIAASVAAGCLTPEEGALVVTRRARLYAQVKGLGAMALVNLPFSQVATELTGRHDIVPAIDSSPSSCVVSGEAGPLAEYVESLKARSIKTFQVKTDIAFHCPMLEKLADPLAEALSKALNPRPAVVPLYSTSNTYPRADSLRNIDYWVNNMISPVWLTSAVAAAVEDGFRVFLEVSTHPIVSHSINETLAERDFSEAATIGTMRRNASAEKSIQHAIAQLWGKGSQVDFKAQFGRAWCTTVPGTPWSQKPYWREVETGPTGQGTQHDVDKHTLLGQRTPVAGTDTVLYTTKLDDKTKPFPGTHPLDGTEIIPAAVYVNTFHHATGGTEISDIKLRVPVSMSSDRREVQIVVQGDEVKVASRLEQKNDAASAADHLEHAWIPHSSARWAMLPKTTAPAPVFDVEGIKKRIGTLLPNSFSWDYLQKIGVSGIAFPWQVVQHYGNEKEMMVRVDMDPETEAPQWDPHSWAPMLDAATSVGSTIFFNDPRMRIVSQIDKVLLVSQQPPPKIGYLFVEEAADDQSPAAHVSVLSESGELLAKFQSMRFSDVEGASGIGGGVESLAHQIAWIPPKFAEKPLPLDRVVLVSDDKALLDQYAAQVKGQVPQVLLASSAEELRQPGTLELLKKKGSAVVYLPGKVESLQEVPEATHKYVWETVCLIKLLVTESAAAKLFVITDRVHKGESATGLAHGALYGLGRIAAQEHPDVWGALIDAEGPQFPTLAIKYVQDQDVVRMEDGMPRVGRMRPLARDQRHAADSQKTLLPKPEGTYVITGGFGDLGLEVLDFLVEKGARRIVVVSRRALPPRSKWNTVADSIKPIVAKIRLLEKQGASIHAVALDIGAEDAPAQLLAALDRLSLPPVLGVIHAAGVLEDNLILDTTAPSFARVLQPKVAGALALHAAFPPATLDFFVLFSSIGQLVGTAGQAPYGSANAFLDALATHRRVHGDNAVAFQWTAWRGLGMATATDFLTVELNSKGITDISRDEGFRAWEHVAKFDVAHSVITRARPLEPGEPAPIPLVEEIAPRRVTSIGASAAAAAAEDASKDAEARPKDGPELKAWLSVKIRECIGAVLMMNDIEDIDPRAAVADLGVDSVMTVALRTKLQQAMSIKVPPTLTWNHPTVVHLVEWFYTKLTEN